MGFVLGHVLWMLLAPGNLLLFLLLLGLALWLFRRPYAILPIALATAGFAAIVVLPLADWIAAPLENRFPRPVLPDDIAGIVMLGGGLDPVLTKARGQAALNDAAERVTETVLLARRYPNARIVLSGGEGLLFASGLSEAAATRNLLVDLGIPAERIETEAKSRSTYENAINSRDLVQPKPAETWLLVTSAMHMPRAVGCFRRAGWEVVPYPVDYRTPRSEPERRLSLTENLSLVTNAGREWVGLVSYYAFGRTDALFPRPERDPFLRNAPQARHDPWRAIDASAIQIGMGLG